MTPGPDAPATLTSSSPTPQAYSLEPSAAWPAPTPTVAPPAWESKGIAIVVVPTIILGIGWLVVWFFANLMLSYCRTSQPASTLDMRLIVAIATVVWMLPSVIGQDINRRRGRADGWQWWLAGSIAVIGALVIPRLDHFELCLS